MASSKKTRARRRPGDFLQFLAFSVIAGFLAAIIVVPPAVSAGMVANASMSWFQDLPNDIADGISSRPSTITLLTAKPKSRPSLKRTANRSSWIRFLST